MSKLLQMETKIAFFLALALTFPLSGCGVVDSGATFVPEAFRQPTHKAEIEQPPDVHLIVRNKMSEIFTAAAEPTDISLCSPYRPNRRTSSLIALRSSIGPSVFIFHLPSARSRSTPAESSAASRCYSVGSVISVLARKLRPIVQRFLFGQISAKRRDQPNCDQFR